MESEWPEVECMSESQADWSRREEREDWEELEYEGCQGCRALAEVAALTSRSGQRSREAGGTVQQGSRWRT